MVRPSHPRILLCTPVPAEKPSWNISDSVITNDIIPVINKVAKENGLQVIDLHTEFGHDADHMQHDGIHPSDKGVARMAEIISAKIK
jgi:lysophospholipase L1-like esterase